MNNSKTQICLCKHGINIHSFKNRNYHIKYQVARDFLCTSYKIDYIWMHTAYTGTYVIHMYVHISKIWVNYWEKMIKDLCASNLLWRPYGMLGSKVG